MSQDGFKISCGKGQREERGADNKICDLQWGFSGISTFAHLPYVKCLTAQDVEFDIGIVGVPFDTAVSYRPGEFMARFCSS